METTTVSASKIRELYGIIRKDEVSKLIEPTMKKIHEAAKKKKTFIECRREEFHPVAYRTILEKLELLGYTIADDLLTGSIFIAWH